MTTKATPLAAYFGVNLATILSGKITEVYPGFKAKNFITAIKKNCPGKSLTQRIELIAEQLKNYLPADYNEAILILKNIMGKENSRETGMFKEYYWLMPVGKYIEKYGLEYFDTSMSAIEELTKRNTGEYAIRPYIRQYPVQTLQQMKTWASSENFHLRRLASEGLRPKLPWASKLELFIENPKPVFEILTILKKEPVLFVKKSVANHLTDYIKVNPGPTFILIKKWSSMKNEHTQWIIQYATRKLKKQ